MPQSLASIVRAQREQQQTAAETPQRAAGNALYVAQGNPRAPAAQAIAEQAGKRLGLPPMLVDDAALAEARVRSNMDALSNAHRTAGWISDPNNAAVASDQVEHLTGIEGFLSNWRGQIARDIETNVMGARRVGAGAYEAIGGSFYGLGLTGERVLDRLGLADGANAAAQSGVPGLAIAGLPSFLKEVGARNRRAAAYLRGEKGSERALSEGVPDLLPRSNLDLGFSGDVAEGLGQIGGQVLTAVGTGGFGSLPSMWGQGVTQMDDRLKADQKKDGRAENSVADDLALAGGGFVTAITEKLGLDAIMGALPAPIRARLTNKLADVAVAGFTEGTSEVLEGVGQNALAMTLLGEDTGLLDGDLAYQGGVGATVGATARALIMTAIPGRQHLSNNQQADRALQEGERFAVVVQTVRQSEMAKRSPERFADFLKTVADPDAEVVIPAEAVATFFQDNPDLDAWMDEWDIRGQVEEARAAGTDVVMSQAAYLAQVAPTAAHDAWAPDIRFGLGEMSQREAEAFRTDGEADLSAALDTAVETAQAQEEAVTPERQVRDALFSQLREAGYTADAANTQATLAARAFARRAERSPERFADAQAAYEAAGLRIEQEFPEVVRQSMDRLDVMVEALRRRSARPSDRRLFGRSMMEFLAQRGGVLDTGGELAALGVDSWHRPSQGGKAFRRRFTRNAEMGGAEFAPDLAAQAAVEAGYLPEGAGPNELFSAVRDELAGRPTYSQQFEADLQSQENADALDEMERLMGDLGLTTADDVGVIRERLERAAAGDGSESVASFNQSTPYTGPRGQISFGQGRATIKLFQSRDLSTFFHEFGHLTLEMLRDDAADPNASDQVKADLQVVLDWFSREAGRTITAADIGVEQHELWARGNEKYMMEGKAPSLELREVFRTVMAWLKNIYGAVLMINAPITDDVRGVMDRLLASDAEIAQARDAAGQALGADAYRQLGATDAEAAAYERQLARARSDAESDLLAQVMRAIRRVRTKEWNEAADEIRAEITAEVDAMPDIAALEFMKTTRTPMDRETAVAMLGDEAGLALLPKRVPPIVAATGGVHPDMIAEAAGYRSGQAMLNGLMEMEAEKRSMVADGDDRSVRKARIENRIREALLDRYGDPMNDGSIEREALDAIHSERYGEVLALDLNLLARRTGNAPAPIDALRAWARDRVGSRPVREARPGRYLRAERTASTAVQRALAAGDRDEAFRQKQAQAINNVLYVEAGRAERFADAAINRMRRLGRGRNPSIHVDYMEQIDAILEQYELKAVSGRTVQRRASLAAFVEAQTEAGEPINIPADVLASLTKTNLADLTVDELRGLDAAVKNLVHLGRLKTTLILNGERRELDRLADEAWATAQYLPDVRADEAPGDKSAWENITGWGARMEASLVKAQEYFRLLDGGDRTGVFHEALDRPGQEAADRRVALQDAFWTPVLEAKKAVPDKIQASWLDVVEDHPFINPNTGQPVQSLKRRDLLGAALHVGTLSNFEKMAKGYSLISKEADAIAVSTARLGFIGWLNERLDATEWAYVQSMWDAHERLRPDYFATARKVEGAEPDPVEPEVVNTPAGPLRGGYAPISYNPAYDQAAQAREQREAASMFGDVMSAGPRPDNGSTNARTAYVGPIKLGLDDARYQAERHITYAAYAEYITNSLKFIRQPLIASAIKRKLGLAAYNTFEPWLAGQVRDETVTDPGANPILQLAKGIRTNMTAAVLMGSATVLLAQPGGLAQASVHLGPKWMAKGVGHAVGLGASGNLRGFITERSEFMRLRVEQGDLDRDYRLAMQQARGAEGLRAQALTITGKAIAMVDFYTVSGATWMGAYDKALSEGRDESQAVYLADMAVRVTQGGGRAIDQAGIQRANEVTKMMTFAYGWANAFYNMQRAVVVDLKNGQDRFENAVRLTSLLVLPALLDAALSGDWPKEGDTVEETIRNVAAWFARNVFFGAAAGVPLLRDVAGTGERLAAGQFAGPVGQTPYGRLGDSVFRLGNDAWTAAFEPDKDVSRRWPAHLIQTTGLAVGIPGTTQAARAVNYLTDVRDGEQRPDGVLDWMNGLLRGPQKDQEQ